MARTQHLSIVGSKGGCGKSTLAMNIGALCADFELRALLVDADPQGTISKWFPLRHTAPEGLQSLLQSGAASAAHISKTSIKHLDVIRSDFEPADVAWFETHMRRDVHLKYAMRNNFIFDNYDVVIYDSQGTQGALQEAVALAGDDVLTPITPHVINFREFRDGTLALLDRLAHSREPVGRLHAIVYNYENYRSSQEIIELIRATPLGTELSRISLLNTMIPRMASFVQAQGQAPVHRLDCRRKYKSPCAAEYLHQLAGELFPMLRGRFAPDMPHHEWPDNSPARSGLPESVASMRDVDTCNVE
jgi:chromosome partitioning related protein ParA